MSRIKEIVDKQVIAHKEAMKYIDGCDIKEETEYFFEHRIIPYILEERDYKFLMLSDRFIELFIDCMKSKYDIRYNAMNSDKLFIKITDEIKSYMHDIEYLRVIRNEIGANSMIPSSYELQITIDKNIFI